MLIIEFVYNNSYYILIKTLLFNLIYNYYLEIYYKVKNNYIKKKILSTQKYIKQIYNLRKVLTKYLKNIVA